MKKRAFTFAGLFISLIGLFLIIKNLSLTGFAISETINNSTSYLLPLVLFIGGILIATTGDGLQAWLERKEKEHASPSLEGKLQTPNEKKEFDRRYSGKHSFFKRLIGKRHVREVPQKERVSDGKEDYEGDKLHNNGYLIGQRKEELDRISKEISLARKDIFKYKSKMNEDSEKGETLMMASWVKGYTQAVDNLKQLYEQMSLSFPIDNYKKLKDAQAKKGFIRGLEELKKDIIENRSSFSPYTGKIPERFKGLQDLKEVEQLEQDLPKVQELIDLYIQGAKTVPVSELSRKYGVLVTHGISDLFKPKGHEDRGLMSWNVPGLSSEQRKNMDFKDYFKILIKDKPMISTATIIGSEIPLGPVGVILREGSVYDAEREDLMERRKRRE